MGCCPLRLPFAFCDLRLFCDWDLTFDGANHACGFRVIFIRFEDWGFFGGLILRSKWLLICVEISELDSLILQN